MVAAGLSRLISDISVGFAAKFEPSYLGDYSRNEFSDTLYGITLGVSQKARSFSFPSNNIKLN